jgi:hypothetical protein
MLINEPFELSMKYAGEGLFTNVYVEISRERFFIIEHAYKYGFCAR